MIPFVDLELLHSRLETELVRVFRRTLRRNHFILGDEVQKFEKSFAGVCGAKYCVGVGNGFDALYIALKIL